MVTGAGNGIGRACAIRLAQRGHVLAVLDIDEVGLEATAAAIAAQGGRSASWRADCSSEPDVVRTFGDVERRLGEVHVLVNNVGQSARERASEFWRSEPITWRRVVELSLISTMLCSRQVVAGMRERRVGRIVNMSSDASLVGDVGIADYVAAKSGVNGFTRALARELAPFHVTVNAVAPGAIRTAAHDRLPKDVIDKVIASVPAGFVGEPEDVAAVVAFLASDEARYVTGQTWLVDGGRYLH